ncbi:sushi domain-containing protein 6-like, partial [Polyodon spathula]|uniref:sushi domain-containing protein 6-like n=1 Tax=Polyodon spathula TaxID=7913 RepID=UPI001B7ED746
SVQKGSHPLVPEHGGFRCAPSPCRGFAPKRVIEYFCEPGYTLHGGAAGKARCRRGNWSPEGPVYCTPDPESKPGSDGSDSTDGESSSLPTVATTAVAVSVFLLTTTACMLVKPRVRDCHCDSRRLSDQLGLVTDRPPVLLPSYEEAVYGNQGNLAPSTQGPTQLLFAEGQLDPAHQLMDSQSDSLLGGSANHCPDTLPPPYEEVQSHSGAGRTRNEQRREELSQMFRVSTVIEKDV